MIVTVFVKLATFLLSLISWLLPEWLLPAEFVSSFSDVFVSVLSWDSFIPVSDILIVFTIILTFEIAILFTRLITGLVSILRGGGSIDV